MIDLRQTDIVATERTSAGRFAIYTRTDVLPNWPVPWWCAMLDTGADAYGVLARIDTAAAPEGWTGRQLLAVALARSRAELVRSRLPSAGETLRHLEAVERVWPREGGGGEVSFRAGGVPTAYPWLVATAGEFDIALCPDATSQAEGIAPEQVLLVLRRLVADAAHIWPFAAWAPEIQSHLAAALAAEARRAARANLGSPPTPV